MSESPSRPTRIAALLPAALLSLLACTEKTPSSSPSDAGALAAVCGAEAQVTSLDPPARPNVIFVLVDDLSWNLVEHMPNVRAMQRDGATFDHYFVSDSLCCPSRSSIFTGRFPHNTGVFTNQGANGGYGTHLARGNDQATFATALQANGYRTAFMGKYMNGYLPERDGVPLGWTDWVGAGGAYGQYNYTLNVNGALVHHGREPSDYLTDVMADLGRKLVCDAALKRQPFLLELSPFAPHGPFTPAPRHEALFGELVLPKTPAFGVVPGDDAPAWMRELEPLDEATVLRLDSVFRRRVRSVQAVDEMIGALRKLLADSGLDRSTYVFFSSDNGFHLGERTMLSGKQTAFDTDIRVPLIVTGPGVAAGSTIGAITQNVDLCPTFEELGGLSVRPAVDGRSLAPLLRGESPPWRTAALVEHRGPVTATDDPDLPEDRSGNPPSYEALRLKDALFVEYVTGETEYYDLTKDPHQLHNVSASLSAESRDALRAQLQALKGCRGGACWPEQSSR
jgi:N-acetylglucosamine-6-sulfatase